MVEHKDGRTFHKAERRGDAGATFGEIEAEVKYALASGTESDHDNRQDIDQDNRWKSRRLTGCPGIGGPALQGVSWSP
jgi:hypothetical protein